MQTPHGAKGINAHYTFLEKYEDIMSSPSRRLSNSKFRKGSTFMAVMGEAAREELSQKQKEHSWGSKSLVLSEEDAAKRVKPRGGGRMISSGEGLRIIGERNEAKVESELEKARREAQVATNTLKRVEEKAVKAEARKQKKIDSEAAKAKKKTDRELKKITRERERQEKKAAKVQKLQQLLNVGKKPRGRPPTIKVEEATQQEPEPVAMATSQRPVRIKRPTHKAVLIPSDTEEDSNSDADSPGDASDSSDSDSDVNRSDIGSGGGSEDYDDYI